MIVTKLVPARIASSGHCAELLREALGNAERGQMRAVLVVSITAERDVETGYEMGDAPMALVGATTVAIRDMIEDFSE